jgi:predicted metal-dependent hydrolase
MDRLMEGQQDPRFLKGIEEFNRGLFFECHETLEEIWLEEHGKDREFYQGIIQIAAGYFKWEQGVLTGAIKLLRAGLEKLPAYPPLHLGVNVDSFIQEVKGNLKEIEFAYQKGEGPPALKAPVIKVAMP